MSVEDQQKYRVAGGVVKRGGRWYASVAIWPIEKVNEPPISEMLGPDGGLDSADEALVYYTRRVKPNLRQLGQRVKEAGGTCELVRQPTLH